MKLLFTILFFGFGAVLGFAQCDLLDTFSSSTPWTQVGTNVTISNGKARFKNGAANGSQRRIYRSIGTTLNATKIWKVEVDFYPDTLGVYPSTTDPMTSHLPIALTAGTQDMFSNCPNVACTGYPVSNQDGVAIHYVTSNPSDGNVYFQIKARDGKREYTSKRITANTLKIIYYLRLERTSETNMKMSVFTDSVRTKHITGSPMSLTIPKTLTGLNTAQIGGVARGWSPRQLTGWVDNLCLDYTLCKTVKPVLTNKDTLICYGDSVRLTATGGVHYKWNNAQFLSKDNVANVWTRITSSKTYRVIGFDNNGCSDTAFVKVDVAPAITANAGNDTTIKSCFSDSISLQASGGLTYSWSPSQYVGRPNSANTKVWPSQNSTFQVVAINAYGCKDSDEVQIQIALPPKAYAGADTSITCLGDSITLKGAGGPSYKWGPSSQILSSTTTSGILVSPTQKQQYHLVVTDSFGCTDTDYVWVDVKGKNLTANAGGDTYIPCIGKSVELKGTGGVQYTWTSLGLFSNQQNITVSPEKRQRYKLTVTDSFGCKDVDFVWVNVFAGPKASAGDDTHIHCTGDSVDLNGAGGYNFEWSPSQFISNPKSQKPKASPPTKQEFRLVVTDTSGCSDTDFVWVDVLDGPLANAGRDMAICKNEIITLRKDSHYRSQWLFSSTMTPVDSSNILIRKNTQFHLIIEDSFGCRDTDDVMVFVNPLPNANAGKDTTVCPNDSVLLRGSGGLSYRWKSTSPVINTSNQSLWVKIEQRSVFYLTAIDGNGCRSTDEVNVSVFIPPTVRAWPDTVICEGEGVNLYASGGGNYQWGSAPPVSSRNSEKVRAKPSKTSRYTVTVTSADGCSDTASVLVVVAKKAIAAFHLPSEISDYQGLYTLQNNSSGASIYQWLLWDSLRSSETNPQITFPKDGQYFITLIALNDSGCHDTVTLATRFQLKPPFLIPNVFSPNGDGINDLFQIIDLQPESRLHILNRWGVPVFESTDYQNDWDGTSKGKELSNGVYFYVLTSPSDGVKKSGTVTLVR